MSHVVPEFVYRPLYDNEHRFNVLSTTPRRHRPYEQKGLRERLLCEACEGRLSTFERYARGVLFGGVPITGRRDGRFVHLSGIDYQRLKLFQLSILWRASIASHALFSRVQLGPYEETLRTMLLNEVAGRADEFPCLMIALRSRAGAVADFIDQPTRLRVDGHVAYRFIFSSIMWVYFVSSRKIPMNIQRMVLSEAGDLSIWTGRFEDLKYLQRFVDDLRKLGRWPPADWG